MTMGLEGMEKNMEADPYLLFDLDGTLSDPLEGIARSVNYALAAFGYETRPHGDLARFIGPPLDLTFRELTATGDEAHVRELVEGSRSISSWTGGRFLPNLS